MLSRLLILGPAAILAASCPGESDSAAPREPSPGVADPPGEDAPANTATSFPEPGPKPAALLGETIARAEWAKAANRLDCAPLALASDGGGVAVDAKARRANFSEGWGVAFDTPGLRSAFGFAGPGLLPADRADFAVQIDALVRQWPYARRWDAGENLPSGSAAGYGVMGAEPYPADNQAGHRLHSLAYLRIPGQTCQYNVWSRISRVHLETILGLLRVVDAQGAPR